MDEADLRDVPDEYVYQNPNAAVGKAEEMGLDDGEIHQHPPEGEVEDEDDVVFMPGSSHESLMDHLREEGLLGDGDAGADADGSDDPTRASSPGGAAALQDDPTTTTPTTTMSDNDSDTDARERVTELKAELSDRQERIAELEAEVEQLRDERDDVARAYAEALTDAGETVLSADDLVDRFEVAELRERLVEVTDADDASAALADTEPAVQSGGGTETETADLSEAEQAEAADHREVIADLAGKGGVAAHERRHRAEQLADITGEDPETILEQYA
jgi:vacuolar-type H+-ATPase subunit I/STV1